MSTAYEQTAFAAEINDETPMVDLHGMSANEAVYALDSAINHAFMQGANAIRIIHGRGSGVLRDAIHAELRRQTELVAYFRDASGMGQVGGMTVAVLHSK